MAKSRDFLMRISEEEHARIKEAATLKGMSMAAWLREHALAAAAEILDCGHPAEFRKIYPWSETCMKCGQRLKG